MSNSRGCLTPRDPNCKLEYDDEDPFDPSLYKRAVGQLQFIATCTRPDIIFAVNQASNNCKTPTTGHWNEVRRSCAI